MRCCSGRGGRGISSFSSFFRLIRFLVVPDDNFSACLLTKSELNNQRIKRLLQISKSSLRIVISTAVMLSYPRFGAIHALAIGCAILEIKISPGLNNVQFSSFALFLDMNLFDLFKKQPTPISPNCINLTSLPVLRSLDNIQSPSLISPDLPTRLTTFVHTQPLGSLKELFLLSILCYAQKF
ncbi:hypothetical protein ES703_94294 [subsurface metagenome]